MCAFCEFETSRWMDGRMVRIWTEHRRHYGIVQCCGRWCKCKLWWSKTGPWALVGGAKHGDNCTALELVRYDREAPMFAFDDPALWTALERARQTAKFGGKLDMTPSKTA